MNANLFAMDTCFFHRDGRYSMRARAEMLKELGYVGSNATLWDNRAWVEIPELIRQFDSHGLTLSGVYLAADVATGKIDERLQGVLQLLAGRSAFVELSLISSGEHDKPSSPRADSRAADLVNRLADNVSAAGLRLSLYPHCNHWLERIEDAARLLMRINRPDVGMTFNLFHWLYADGQDLQARFDLALPRLCNVTINGSTWSRPRECTIEPLDQGNFDLFAFLGRLGAMGYMGPMSLQGYGIGGDVYAQLRRSMTAWRDLHLRLARHANWAKLDPPFGG